MTGLRLQARNKDEMDILSACLQDAITRLTDISYQPRQRRLALVLTRYMWERDPRDQSKGEKSAGWRVRTGMHFDDILSLRSRNIDQSDREGLLDLLAIHVTPEDDLFRIELRFAGGGDIELLAESINAEMHDMGTAWKTQNRPDHRGEEEIP